MSDQTSVLSGSEAQCRLVMHLKARLLACGRRVIQQSPLLGGAWLIRVRATMLMKVSWQSCQLVIFFTWN